MQDTIGPLPANAISQLSGLSLATVLDYSTDCVKLINLDGAIRYMNMNGQCAMEIDNFGDVDGLLWTDLWPDEASQRILNSYYEASAGRPSNFRAFCPTAKGTPRWWDVSVCAVSNEHGSISGYLVISRDVTENHNSREALMIAAAELKHRLKNTYQMIASLMMMMSKGDAAHEAFAGQMATRLRAMSRAQTLFADDNAPCDLHELIPTLVSPFGSEATPLVYEGLPVVSIEQTQADAIALVIGELAVNSSKYGALAGGGKILVDGSHETDLLTIAWNEFSNRPVQQHTRETGQGMKLMDRIMQARNGSFRVEWQSNGLVATLSLKTPA